MLLKALEELAEAIGKRLKTIDKTQGRLQQFAETDYLTLYQQAKEGANHEQETIRNEP